MHLTFRQISYFVATADAGSISGASVHLNISQSAITESLRDLEAEIGATLFHRNSKGVTLTYDGQRFLQHSRLILATVADAGRVLKANPEAVSGSLSVGVTSLVSGYFLADLLVHFRRLFPNFSINVLEHERAAIEDLLIKGELDVALMLVSNIENQNALEFGTLARSRCRIWLPAEHALLSQDAIALSTLVREPLIELSIDEMPRSVVAAWSSIHSRPSSTLTTSSVEAVRSLVATGAGWAIMPDIAYRPWSLERDRLEVRPIRGNEIAIDVGLAWRRSSAIPERAESFRQLIRDFSPDRPLSHRLRRRSARVA
ncbi:LysR substrate-binding domain-containing protein [Bradyrhizobium sp. WSM3983]|uniref:LysR substrate-binding domain-containing protein n=1 Tax=Bradyrhizobium sp. WSM3983 TaxID=1038867 RepID=UPI00047F9D0E|nr:LysR substrate-binding domain-containing protein [Bradyrhizobium sp. WSM3983]